MMATAGARGGAWLPGKKWLMLNWLASIDSNAETGIVYASNKGIWILDELNCWSDWYLKNLYSSLQQPLSVLDCTMPHLAQFLEGCPCNFISANCPMQ